MLAPQDVWGGAARSSKWTGIKILAFTPFYDYILTNPLRQYSAFFCPDLDSMSRLTNTIAILN